MRKSGYKIRSELFDLYSKNLSHFLPSLTKPVFACPICKTVFYQEAIIDHSSSKDGSGLMVNVAHCYPESCGGKDVTLACKNCNTQMGTQYEHHLAIEKKLNDAFNPDTLDQIPVKLRFNAGSIPATLSRIGENHIFAMDKNSNPYIHPKIVEELRVAAANNHLRFSMVVQRPDNDRVSVALLHTAFLMMFREFGYEYALSPMAEQIRKSLLAEEVPKNLGLSVMNVPKSTENSTLLNTVGIITAPEDCRCFYAMMPSADPKMLGRVVLMPGLGDQGQQAIQNLRAFNGRNFRVSYQSHPDDIVERLGAFAHRTFLRYWWEDYPSDFAVTAELICAISNEPNASIQMGALSEKLGLNFNSLDKFAKMASQEDWIETKEIPLPTTTVRLTAKGIEFSKHIPFWTETK